MTSGRPKSPTLLTHTDDKWIAYDVMAGTAVYVVSLDGQPINLCKRNVLRDRDDRYQRTAFILAGHAFSWARKLNKMFHTDRFGVLVYRPGRGEPLSREQYEAEFLHPKSGSKRSRRPG